MNDKPEDTVVEFRAAAPSARMKSFADIADARRHCRHKHVEIWSNEPILECRDCGGVVDPYYWIRQRCSDWKEMENAVAYRISDMKREAEELKTAIRHLRGEWRDEGDKIRAQRHLMVQAPRRSF